MNRCRISIGILLALVALCVYGLSVLHRQCDSFSAQTDTVIAAAAAGDTEQALIQCEELLDMWDGFHDVTGVFVDGSRLVTIREILAGLPALIAAEHPELLSELQTLRSLVEDIFQEELPEWWHIL